MDTAMNTLDGHEGTDMSWTLIHLLSGRNLDW